MPTDAQSDGRLYDVCFLIIVAILTLALAWVVEPFIGAVLWSLVAAILFTPLYRRLRPRLGGRNRAAIAVLTIIVVLIIVPAIFLAGAMIQEAGVVYVKFQRGEIDLAHSFRQAQAALPGWATALMARFGLTDFDALVRVLQDGLSNSFQTVANQAFVFGQSAIGFVVSLGVMLYVTYFLIRDADKLEKRVTRAVPLHDRHRRALTEQFIMVIRATVKGTIVVAIVQGTIGGVTFWLLGIQGPLLWGVVMAFFSLIPAFGTAIIWAPVAAFLLFTGQIWEGVALIACGVLVIGLIDNILRPILVGRDARMPDFMVLVTTLGGLEIFGVNGFVIGPVIAGLFLAAWNIMANDRALDEAEPKPG